MLLVQHYIDCIFNCIFICLLAVYRNSAVKYTLPLTTTANSANSG